MSAWGVGATSTLLLLLHGHEIARGTLAPLGGLGSAAPWIVVASIAAADLSMTVFCTARSLEMPRLAAPGRAWPRLAAPGLSATSRPPPHPHPTPTPTPTPTPPHARAHAHALSGGPAWGVITNACMGRHHSPPGARAQPRLSRQTLESPRRPAPRARASEMTYIYEMTYIHTTLRFDLTGMVDGLGANAYSVSRCLAMAATPPLAVPRARH
jgi:hypothetical protein